MGSNHRRLSRRFYSLVAPPESPSANQHGRRPGRKIGLPPSAMRPWLPDFGPVRATDGGGTGHGRARKKPRTGRVGAVMPTTLTRIPALNCHFRMHARCRCRLVTEVLPGVLGAEGVGDALVGGAVGRKPYGDSDDLGGLFLALACSPLHPAVEDRIADQPETRQSSRSEVPSEELHPKASVRGERPWSAGSGAGRSRLAYVLLSSWRIRVPRRVRVRCVARWSCGQGPGEAEAG